MPPSISPSITAPGMFQRCPTDRLVEKKRNDPPLASDMRLSHSQLTLASDIDSGSDMGTRAYVPMSCNLPP